MTIHTVWRHGGNRNHRWRRILTDNLDLCIVEFERIREKLRQGMVIILPDDKDPNKWDWTPPYMPSEAWCTAPSDAHGYVYFDSGPRLRSRW